MLKNTTLKNDRAKVSRAITAGTVIGGVIGVVILDSAITGLILGVIIGGGLGAFIGVYINRDKTYKYSPDIDGVKFQLREEQLDILKRSIQTGEVTIQKEVLTEEKNIIVPVTREELVIKKKVLNNDTLDNADGFAEITRIPITTEDIDVKKHQVILEDVEIYKRQFHDVQHIEENLKKEKVHVEANNNKVHYSESSHLEEVENKHNNT